MINKDSLIGQLKEKGLKITRSAWQLLMRWWKIVRLIPVRL